MWGTCGNTSPPSTHRTEGHYACCNALLLLSAVLDNLMFERVFCTQAEEGHAMCVCYASLSLLYVAFVMCHWNSCVPTMGERGVQETQSKPQVRPQCLCAKGHGKPPENISLLNRDLLQMQKEGNAILRHRAAKSPLKSLLTSVHFLY